MILVLDNYDSFTYNLVQELAEVGETALDVVRNDVAGVDELLARRPRAIVVSPGPGAPEDAGVTVELVRRAERVPLLGICLGHQALVAAWGGRIERAPEPVHGKTAEIHHTGKGLFAGLPEPMVATRYHSLVAARETLPEELELIAWTADDLVMGVRHLERPHWGVQFHPESYLCRDGRRLLARFLELAELPLRPEWREGR